MVLTSVVTAFLIDDFDVVRAQFEAERAGDIPEWKRRAVTSIADIGLSDKLEIVRKSHALHICKHGFASLEFVAFANMQPSPDEALFKDEIEEHLRRDVA